MVTKTGEMRLTKETERGEKQQNCVRRRRIEKDKKKGGDERGAEKETRVKGWR